MKYYLIISTLKIKSSFVKDYEVTADNRFDTVQFCITPDSIWRIKTFAVDNDIHVVQIGKKGGLDEVSFAVNNTNKFYGDVMNKTIIIGLKEYNLSDLTNQLKSNKLEPNIEMISKDAFFWNPDKENYKTQSKPDGV